MSQFNTAIRSSDAFVPEPAEKMRGLPLVATWAVLITAPWAAFYGLVQLAF